MFESARRRRQRPRRPSLDLCALLLQRCYVGGDVSDLLVGQRELRHARVFFNALRISNHVRDLSRLDGGARKRRTHLSVLAAFTMTTRAIRGEYHGTDAGVTRRYLQGRKLREG